MKIADFGLSAKYNIMNLESRLKDHCGTEIYMAPEMVMHEDYSKYVDIWAAGVIMYILISGHHPLYDPGDDKYIYWNKLQMQKTFKFDRSVFSPIAQDLIERLTKFKPSQRIPLIDALQHPWITRENKSIPKSMAEAVLHVQLSDQPRSLFCGVTFLA